MAVMQNLTSQTNVCKSKTKLNYNTLTYRDNEVSKCVVMP